MVNKLLSFAGIIVLAGGLFLLTMPVTHIPLLDANRQVLAESEREGWCAGDTYMKTRGGGDESLSRLAPGALLYTFKLKLR